jgi:fermentation-respiration switch protein FrsA (DUF1100 family)
MLGSDATRAPEAARGPGRTRPRWQRRLTWTLRGLLAALLIGALIVRCDSWFYYPSQRVWETPPQLGLRYEDVRFSTADGVSLHGWWLPAETRHLAGRAAEAAQTRGEQAERSRASHREPSGASHDQQSGALHYGAGDAARAKGTVIHFHGNAENVTAHLVLVEWLPRAGYNVLMFDYRGYGQSGGRITRAGTIRDGHAAVDYVLSRPDVDRRRIFAYGQSLGGAIAVSVAAERPEIRAVVAESAFSGYRRIAAVHLRKMVLLSAPARGLAALLVSSGHDPIDVVERISPRPLLVIAAEHDQICDPRLGRELYEAAGEPKEFWLVPGAGHLAILESAGEELEARVLDFLERAGR